MRIKKYIASTMKEALEDMRRDLGEDAVILSTRTVPRSAANGREAVEITAASDAVAEVARRPLVADADPAPNALDILQFAEQFARNAAPAPSRRQAAPAAPATPVAAAPTPPDDDRNHTLQHTSAFIRLQEELSSIRDTLHSVAGEVRYRHSGALTPVCRTLYEALIDRGLRENLALEAIGTVTAEGLAGTLPEALTAARKVLLGGIPLAEPLQAAGRNRRVYAFVGPTGVGKTTTVAKLATALHVLGQTRVRLISADTYRVGGAEQLETIAAIAGIPFHSVYSSQELRQVLHKHTDAECVFIDTVGRNPRNAGHLQEIAAYMEAADADRVFLVQSATSSEQTIRQTLERFAAVQTTDLILTKLDETAAIGPVIGALHECALPLAYVTTGQSIPDDIEQAGRRILAELLLPPSLDSEEQEVTIE